MTDKTKECWDKLTAKEKEIHLDKNEFPRCPKCGHLNIDMEFGNWYDNDNVEFTCDDCLTDFNASVDITITFSSW